MTNEPWVSACGRATIHHGDCLDVMRSMPDGSVDAVVTDPPYGLAFMGKEWDHGVPGEAFWIEAARVAKPGAHLLAFGGTRTFHRLTCAIEDAGWEVRDCLSWLYGSGFPKSHNGAWGGTALKPAWEPVVLARKPLIGTVAANHAAHGTGALNIDGCRIPTDDKIHAASGISSSADGWDRPWKSDPVARAARIERSKACRDKAEALGRWPANVLLDEDAAAALDESVRDDTENDPGDGPSRYFYTAKASRGEREAGLKEAGLREAVVGTLQGGGEGASDPVSERFTKTARNVHPTVKPVDLMRYLVRLVTPHGATVLDPFLGSGTTLVAALQEECKAIGIEREAQYVEIAKARVAHEARQGALFT